MADDRAHDGHAGTSPKDWRIDLPPEGPPAGERHPRHVAPPPTWSRGPVPMQVPGGAGEVDTGRNHDLDRLVADAVRDDPDELRRRWDGSMGRTDPATGRPVWMGLVRGFVSGAVALVLVTWWSDGAVWDPVVGLLGG